MLFILFINKCKKPLRYVLHSLNISFKFIITTNFPQSVLLPYPCLCESRTIQSRIFYPIEQFITKLDIISRLFSPSSAKG